MEDALQCTRAAWRRAALFVALVTVITKLLVGRTWRPRFTVVPWHGRGGHYAHGV